MARTGSKERKSKETYNARDSSEDHDETGKVK